MIPAKALLLSSLSFSASSSSAPPASSSPPSSSSSSSSAAATAPSSARSSRTLARRPEKKTHPLPALPPELWARILSFLRHPPHLCAASLVCSSWRAHVFSPAHDPVWHLAWHLSLAASYASPRPLPHSHSHPHHRRYDGHSHGHDGTLANNRRACDARERAVVAAACSPYNRSQRLQERRQREQQDAHERRDDPRPVSGMNAAAFATNLRGGCGGCGGGGGGGADADVLSLLCEYPSCLPPAVRVPGLWHHQVAASYRLAALPSNLPAAPPPHEPPARRGGKPSPRCKAQQPIVAVVPPAPRALAARLLSARLVARPRPTDLDAMLGLARCVHTLSTAVVLCFDKGMGVIPRPPLQSSAASTSSSSPSTNVTTNRLPSNSNNNNYSNNQNPEAHFHYVVHSNVANVIALAPIYDDSALYNYQHSQTKQRQQQQQQHPTGPTTLVALTASGSVVLVRVSPSRAVPLRHRVLDPGPPVPVSGDPVTARKICVSDDGQFALATYSGGTVRAIRLHRRAPAPCARGREDSHGFPVASGANRNGARTNNARSSSDDVVGTLTHTFTLPEEVDMVAANGAFVVACNATDPLALSAWRLPDGHCVAAFQATSVGWSGIARLAGLCTTRLNSVFAVLDASGTVRLLDVLTSTFKRAIDIGRTGINAQLVSNAHPSAAPSGGANNASGAGPSGDGANGGGGTNGSTSNGSAVVGGVPGGSLFRVGGKRAVAATNDDVVLFDLEGRGSTRRLHGARHAVFGLSTDGKVAVTGEGDVFGALASAVTGSSTSGRASVTVWDVGSEMAVGEIPLPGRATAVSVCGDVVGVICGDVGVGVAMFAR